MEFGMTTHDDEKPFLNVLNYLEMKAFASGNTNLTAGFRFLQLLIHTKKRSELVQEEKSIQSIETAFYRLKEELMSSGWK